MDGFERQGPLFIQTINSSGSLKKEKQYFAVLFRASTCGQARLEVYKEETSKNCQLPEFYILKEEVIKIVDYTTGSKPHNYILIALNPGRNYLLSSTDNVCQMEWKEALQQALFPRQNNDIDDCNYEIMPVESRNNSISTIGSGPRLPPPCVVTKYNYEVKLSGGTKKQVLKRMKKLKEKDFIDTVLHIFDSCIEVQNKNQPIICLSYKDIKKTNYNANSITFEMSKSNVDCRMIELTSDECLDIKNAIDEKKKKCAKQSLKVSGLNEEERRYLHHKRIQNSLYDEPCDLADNVDPLNGDSMQLTTDTAKTTSKAYVDLSDKILLPRAKHPSLLERENSIEPTSTFGASIISEESMYVNNESACHEYAEIIKTDKKKK